jgi:5-deoxy-D-glucuronate isomerase
VYNLIDEQFPAERLLMVGDKDVVWIPRRYHSVLAIPGNRLYYLWALAGDGRKLEV